MIFPLPDVFDNFPQSYEVLRVQTAGALPPRGYPLAIFVLAASDSNFLALKHTPNPANRSNYYLYFDITSEKLIVQVQSSAY